MIGCLALVVGCGTETASDYPSSIAGVIGQALVENCPNGGVVIGYGIDENTNGVLDTNEVDGTETICHGTNGADGQDGAQGPQASKVLKVQRVKMVRRALRVSKVLKAPQVKMVRRAPVSKVLKVQRVKMARRALRGQRVKMVRRTPGGIRCGWSRRYQWYQWEQRAGGSNRFIKR